MSDLDNSDELQGWVAERAHDLVHGESAEVLITRETMWAWTAEEAA